MDTLKLALMSMKILFGISAAFVALSVLVYVFQDRLIFFPQPLSREKADMISQRYPNAEELTVEAADGTVLRGWLVRTSQLKKQRLIIYFGGNAEEVSGLIPEAAKFDGWALALVNYRGYGMSGGRPSEKMLYSDSVSLYNYLTKRDDVDTQRIVVMGRSLGTGVAVHLAGERRIEAVILVSPFDSLLSVAREKFPFLPVRFLLKHRFDSLSRASSISAPLLVLVASDDTIITPSHSKTLEENWGGPHTLRVIGGTDHNTINDNARYWKEIADFLARL